MTLEPGPPPDTDRLAQLLADSRGAEILAQLQKLRLRAGSSEPTGASRPAEAQAEQQVGIWRLEPGGAGVALRRHGGPDAPAAGWADIEYLPGPGSARRVVLLGESAARGWPYDPVLTCAQVLDRNLAAARPGSYQCVDLARTGATTADLNTLADRLSLVEPDIVVSFVGNNWTLGPHAEEAPASDPDRMALHDALARALRRDGYEGMREVLQAKILDRASGFLDRLATLHRDHDRVQVIIVIPEFNLCGWTPPADLAAPVMPPADLAAWHRLHDETERACREHRWADVAPLADRMRQLDGGLSPVPGQLAGRAALALGDGAAARVALEQSRDAICGLLVRYVPRTTGPVQQLLHRYADRHGWRCLDLRTTLAATDVPELPDEAYFHDYCHLSDAGIERAMAALTDTILDLPPGTTGVGPGLPAPARAFGYAHAAAHLAYTGQPAAAVRDRLRRATRTSPDIAATLAALHDLLTRPYPRWTHPAAERLAGIAPARDFLAALSATRQLPPWLWVLREALADTEGAESPSDTTSDIDLLAGGQSDPSWLMRSHHRAATGCSSLPFSLRHATGGRLTLTYRTPSTPGPANLRLLLNETPVTELPVRQRWADATVTIPAAATRAGVNRLSISWPVPAPSPERSAESAAAALARGDLPQVLPIYGELFAAHIRPDHP